MHTRQQFSRGPLELAVGWVTVVLAGSPDVCQNDELSLLGTIHHNVNKDMCMIEKTNCCFSPFCGVNYCEIYNQEELFYVSWRTGTVLLRLRCSCLQSCLKEDVLFFSGSSRVCRSVSLTPGGGTTLDRRWLFVGVHLWWNVGIVVAHLEFYRSSFRRRTSTSKLRDTNLNHCGCFLDVWSSFEVFLRLLWGGWELFLVSLSFGLTGLLMQPTSSSDAPSTSHPLFFSFSFNGGSQKCRTTIDKTIIEVSKTLSRFKVGFIVISHSICIEIQKRRDVVSR